MNRRMRIQRGWQNSQKTASVSSFLQRPKCTSKSVSGRCHVSCLPIQCSFHNATSPAPQKGTHILAGSQSESESGPLEDMPYEAITVSVTTQRHTEAGMRKPSVTSWEPHRWAEEARSATELWDVPYLGYQARPWCYEDRAIVQGFCPTGVYNPIIMIMAVVATHF